MTEEELQSWMKIVNTQTLELIILQADAGRPEWFTQIMTAEVQRRRSAKKP